MTEGVERRERSRVAWLAPAALRLHAVLLAGLALCGVASWIEWSRALEGRELAWVYAFEWPLFAIMGTWVWWRLLHPDVLARQDEQRRAAQFTSDVPNDDPDLVAWQNYVARLEASDPPGGPPQKST